MAGASDKARFYLEQSVPELHELLKKKLFTEVHGRSAVTSRRSANKDLARDHVHRKDSIRL